MVKNFLLVAAFAFCAILSFGQQGDNVEYVGETNYRLPNTLDIIYARMEEPAYHNEFAQFILDDPTFPKQTDATPEQIKSFRAAIKEWVQSNPSKIIKLWEAREEAVAKFANPDPKHIPNNK